jgi:hypothetical protein
MSGTETVSLNLAGDFAAQAQAAASAADALQSRLGALKPPSGLDRMQQQLKAFQVEAAAAEKAAAKFLGQADKSRSSSFDSAMKSFLGSRSAMPEALQPKITPKLDFAKNAFAGVFSAVGNAFGPEAASGLRDGAGQVINAAEKLAPVMPLLKAGGAAIGAGAVALGAAAVALVYGAAKLAGAIVSFGIEQTAAREKQAAIFRGLGAAGGEKVAIKLAADFGLDTDKAMEQVKGLLAAKFSQEEIPAIIRIAAGISAVRGEGKAQAFLEKLETQAAKGGKASEDTIKGFAEAGINVDSVWAKLAAKLGVSVKQAQAKVKSGAVDMKTALDAVKDAGAEGFGGVADELGKSVPALLGKIKIQFASLFAGMDLGPMKGALESVSKILGGPAGEKLGGALSRMGNAAIKALFGPFEGEKGEERLTKFLHAITNAIDMATNVIVAVAPYIEKVIDGFSRIFGDRQTENATGFQRALFGVLDAFTALATLDPGGFLDAIINIGAGIGGAFIGIVLDATDAGLQVARGFAAGISGGAGEAIQAAIGMAQGAVSAVRQALGVASPSKAFEFLGDMSKEGFIAPMNDNGGDVAAAGKSMAESAIGGAASAGGDAGAGGGAGASGSRVYNITVQVVAAAGQDAQATGQAIADAIRRELRAVDREAQERAA